MLLKMYLVQGWPTSWWEYLMLPMSFGSSSCGHRKSDTSKGATRLAELIRLSVVRKMMPIP